LKRKITTKKSWNKLPKKQMKSTREYTREYNRMKSTTYSMKQENERND